MSKNRAREFAIERAAGRSTRTPTRAVPVQVTMTRQKHCGCEERKRWLNNLIPGAGDLVEAITTATGIKRLVQGDQ